MRHDPTRRPPSSDRLSRLRARIEEAHAEIGELIQLCDGSEVPDLIQAEIRLELASKDVQEARSAILARGWARFARRFGGSP